MESKISVFELIVQSFSLSSLILEFIKLIDLIQPLLNWPNINSIISSNFPFGNKLKNDVYLYFSGIKIEQEKFPSCKSWLKKYRKQKADNPL